MTKKRIFSGIQPSGVIHIGNYLGAIKQWIELQEDYECIFSVVDLHAITIPQDPKQLKTNIYNLIATYLACGVNPKTSPVFVQSQVSAHAELAWILNTITYIGDLKIMTQYKDKSGLKSLIDNRANNIYEKAMDILQKQKNNFKKDTIYIEDTLPKIEEKVSELYDYMIELKEQKNNVGLLDYPVLMAADILLYKTNIVPVGVDQKQHVELCRNLAQRFNNRFGETFIVPEVKIRKESARIMGLDNPEKKMSKSAASENNYIALTDSADVIRKKISRAVTDSGKEIVFDQKRAGLYNLLTIYQLFSGDAPEVIEKKFAGRGYGDFKKDLAELLITKLSPIQDKYQKLIVDKTYLDKILQEGRDKVTPIAEQTLQDVKKKIGFIV